MRVAILAGLVFLLGGCLVPIQANLRNDSDMAVFHLTDWKPFEEPIPIGEARKVRLYFPGACIELIVDGTSRFYEVPAPPSEAQLAGYWNPTYSVVLRPDGLFFESNGTLLSRFDEIDDCSV